MHPDIVCYLYPNLFHDFSNNPTPLSSVFESPTKLCLAQRYLYEKDLKQNFHIQQKKDVVMWVDSLLKKDNPKTIINQILIQVYFHFKDHALDTPWSELIQDSFTQELIQKHTKKTLSKNLNYLQELDNKQVLEFFSLLQYTHFISVDILGSSLRALDFINCFKLIHYSFLLGYLDSDLAHKLWKNTTQATEDYFDSFASFFSSLICANQQKIYSKNYGDIILEDINNPLIKRVINLILDPNTIIKSLGPWPVDNLFQYLNRIELLEYQNLYSKDDLDYIIDFKAYNSYGYNKTEFHNSYLLYNFVFLPLAKKYHVTHYFNNSVTNGEFYKADNYSEQAGEFVNKTKRFLKKHSIKLKEQETVLFYFKTALITDRNIYLLHKGLFSSKIESIKWKEFELKTKVDFSCNFLQLKLQNITLAEIELDPSRVNYTQSLTDLEKNQVQELFKKDFTGIKNTFTEFKELIRSIKKQR